MLACAIIGGKLLTVTTGPSQAKASGRAAPSGDGTAPGPQAAPDERGLDAWKAFLRAHARLFSELDAELRAEHGLTIGDFDVLVQLADAPTGRLRMCELADAVLLSPSGLSRRVERLQRAGLVDRERASADARSIEAGLTQAGRRRFRRMRRTHRADIRERFSDRFDAEELDQLEALMGRLIEGPGAGR
ncbi:MAG: MarR family transcriptional regulator [Solirubrobacterales bacterium]|nr:MarR family transcriptional regulator [Solirubrobacterales bacterium]